MVWDHDLKNLEPEEQPFQVEHAVRALAVAFCLPQMFDFKYQELNTSNTAVDHRLIHRLGPTKGTGMTLNMSEFIKCTGQRGLIREANHIISLACLYTFILPSFLSVLEFVNDMYCAIISNPHSQLCPIRSWTTAMIPQNLEAFVNISIRTK